MRTCTLCTALLLFASLLVEPFSEGVLVLKVSETGKDNSSCREPNATVQCRSLVFALKALKDSRNRNETVFTFLVEAENVFTLTERVKINQTSDSVSVYLKSGDPTTRSVIRCAEDTMAGFEIGSKMNTTRNIYLENLEFQNCGSRSVAAVVLIWNSVDINFTNCVFRNNTQAGINAFDSSVTVERCHFVNNTSNGNNSEETYIEGVTSAGGGAGFLFQETTDLVLIVKDSIFEFNSAVTNNTPEYIGSSFDACTCQLISGGGLLVVFKKKAQFCRTFIENNRFSNNSATFGGGLYLEQSNLAMTNNFIIINSSFSGNFAGQAAGGVSFSQWQNASSLTTVFKNCIISENESRRGAGMNVFIMNNDATHNNSVLRFDSVTFTNNRGRASSAIRFTTALPYGSNVNLTAEFINCSFTYHNMSNFARTSPFTSQRINLMFKGNTIFQHNYGGGAAAFQDCVILLDGKLKFVNNTGINGGAVSLASSQIKLYPNSELVFIGNKAFGVGGAIYVPEHVMDEVIHANNPNCFLTYNNPRVPPSKWNRTKVSFIENCSNVKGAAIYISSLQRCVWSETPPHYDAKKALRWDKDHFLYRKNYLFCSGDSKALSESQYDIATDTKNYTSAANHMKIAPGEHFPLNLSAVDELGGHIITSVYAFEVDQANRTTKVMLDNTLYILFPNESVQFSFRVPESLYNDIVTKKTLGERRKIVFTDIYSTIINSRSLEMEVRPCHPGFRFSKTLKTCVCRTELEGVERCENGNKVFLTEGYWANTTTDGRFVTYFCPFEYCKCSRSRTTGLPGCLFDADKSNDQCAENREGWLCGKCRGNTSVGLRQSDCIKCEESGWILGVVIPIVIGLCVLIIWLNPGISSELRGPLFFYQVLPFIFDPTVDKNAYVFLAADIFNFGGPFIYILNTCIFRGIDNLYAIMFGYALPFLVLLVFVLAYLLSHRLTFDLRERSMLRSFWLLLLFVYNYLVETSFWILFCPNVAGKYVFFYDGNVTCFQGRHLPMGIIAIIVLVVMVIPPPIVVFLLTNGYWRVSPQWMDTLTNSLRRERRWWWSFDLCRRVLLVGIYAFVPTWQTKKILMTIACMIILAVHSSCHPYMRPRANYVETVYLLLLSILAILQIYKNNDNVFYVCVAFLAMAVIHTLVVFLSKARRFFRRPLQSCAGGENSDEQRHRYRELENTGTEESQDTEIERRRSIFNAVLRKSTRNSAPGENNIERSHTT